MHVSRLADSDTSRPKGKRVGLAKIFPYSFDYESACSLAGVAGSLIGKYSTPYKCAKAWLMVEELEVDAGGVLFDGCGDVLQPDQLIQGSFCIARKRICILE